MLSNHTNINMETKANIVNKIIKIYSISSKFILEYSY